MSLAHRKTWQLSPKNSVSSPNLFDKVLIGFKDAMKAFPTLPAQVKGSNDGATAGMDLVDRWTFGISLPTAACWIVLYFPGMAMHMCIVRGTAGNAGMFFSYVGFTGGTTIARPTATDEWGKTLDATVAVFNNPVIYNVAQSTDGKCVYAWTSSAPDATLTTWLIGEAAAPVAGWTKPHFAMITTASGAATGDWCGQNAGINAEIITKCLTGDTAVYTNCTRLRFTTACVGNGGANPMPVNMVVTAVNPVTGLPTAMNEFGIGHYNSLFKGRMGVVPDLRPVCGGAEADLLYSRRWIKHHDVLMPWDGVTA